MPERVVVVGAGVAGLACALTLAPRGFDVPARRTTFERVMREYVQERGLARIESGVEVAGLIGEPTPLPSVRGVRIQRAGGEPAPELADVVIDASGRAGSLTRELGALGVQLAEERHDAGILYFTRHYELLPGCEAPLSHGLPAFQYADFTAGALPSDRGAFTVTYQVQRDDAELIAVVREPERFQALCLRIPGLARWVDPALARPTSEVFGFGRMDSYWRSCIADGEPLVLGLHFAGDARVRSNPRYGRGCTWSYVSAELLARTLAETRDPRERALRYDAALERELRADWRTMLAMDGSSRARFEIAVGRRAATLADRAREAFAEWVDEAQAADAEIFRGVWTGYHGLARMDAWLRSPRAWLRLAQHALVRRERRRLLAERFSRPSRAEILASPAAPRAAT